MARNSVTGGDVSRQQGCTVFQLSFSAGRMRGEQQILSYGREAEGPVPLQYEIFRTDARKGSPRFPRPKGH